MTVLVLPVLLAAAADRLLWRRMVSGGGNPKARLFLLDWDNVVVALPARNDDTRLLEEDDRAKILRPTPKVAKAVTATVPPRRTEIPLMASMNAATKRLHLRANDGFDLRLVVLFIGVERLRRVWLLLV